MIWFVCDGQNKNLEETKTGEMMGVITLRITLTQGPKKKSTNRNGEVLTVHCSPNIMVLFSL